MSPSLVEVREPAPRRPWSPLRSLLDVNVWIALLDDAHQFSEEANTFIESPEARIATCPLVENGVIRVMAMPSYGRDGSVPMHRVRQRLQEACASLDHAFWPDDVSLRDDTLVDFSRVQGHQQVTDLYLLALAVRHGGRLVTFDRAVALSSVRGATAEHLLVL
ncbi:MAG: TA system VapC family ribonuclease toxin [Betaproteobacteria bacterium]